MIGIYKIVNIVNNKCYVGSSGNIDNRFKGHKKALKLNKHHSIKLQRSYNTHGIENFKYEVIEECSVELLLTREQYYIDLLDCYNNGYNIAMAANCVMLGRHHSDKTKEVLRQKSMGNTNRLGMTFTDECKKRISEKLKGIPLSEETKMKMKGRKVSDDTKKKISDKLKGKIPTNILTEDFKNKALLSHLGKKQSLETIAKRVEKNTGKKRTDESKKKISDKLKGIIRGPMPEERKLKQSKRVALVSVKGDIIKEYDSAKKCAIDLNITPSRISYVASGKALHHKKMYFKYI